MKKSLGNLFGLLPFGGGAPPSEPTDPAELQPFLFKQASGMIRPYLLLGDSASRWEKNAKVTGELEQAIGLLDRVLVMNEENWAAAWMAGKAAQSLGDQDRAYRYFHRAFALQDANADVARELMLTCLETNRATEAVEVARQAIRIDATDAGLKANLALALVCAGDVNGAEVAIDEALNADAADQVSLTLQRLIGEVKRGERPQPRRPSDLEK